MNILCVDTSGPSAGVAVLRDGRLVFECSLIHGRTHSQCIMPMVEQGLAGAGLQAGDVDLFAAVVGPGSFTGVRIGVSTVKALAHATQRPCIGVDALEALAAGIQDFGGLICPILDARAQQVYGAVFRAGLPPVRVAEDAAEKLVRTAGCEEPDAALTAKYEARYQQFRQIYPTCRELFDRLVF